MKEIVIHMEGGGSSKEQRAQLRDGMNAFLGTLKIFADAKGWAWRLVPRGGREEAWREWSRGLADSPAVLHILLVDSEEEVTRSPREHLRNRVGDGWAIQKGYEPQVHLMAQCMEAWLVADPDALAGYYKQGFEVRQLPKRANLEEEPKPSIYRALERATRRTSKRAYRKIEHASALLRLIDPTKAKARCPHCERLFTILTRTLGSPGNVATGRLR